MFKAKLTNMLSLGAEFIEFDYNPKTVAQKRDKFPGNQPRQSGRSGQGAQNSPVAAKPMKFEIQKAILEGEQCKVRTDLLFSWMSPGGGLIGLAIGAAAAALGATSLMSAPPPLLFIWGPPILGFSWIMQMTACSATYSRVSPDGIPLRSEVTFTLEEMVSLQMLIPTNPTSGGLPGRARHLVTEGENLQNISTSRYGHPKHWRQVADTNGIDNPFKVQPGSAVYLPSVQELDRGRQR